VSEGWRESVQVAKRLFGLFLEEGDEIVSVLGLLETTKGHLGARNVLLGVLEVLKLSYCQRTFASEFEYIGCSHTRVPSSQVIPFCLLASVYE
jgi:hypothetical protein